jgi:hypothetical protein
MQLAPVPHCASIVQNLVQKYAPEFGCTTCVQTVFMVQSDSIVQYLPTPIELPMSPG